MGINSNEGKELKDNLIQSKNIIFRYPFIFFLLLTILFQGIPGRNLFDDAYITFRYARNVSEGMGYVYNLGEKIQGSTTPLFTIILAISGLIFSSEKIPNTAFILSMLFDAGSGWLLFRIFYWAKKSRFLAIIVGTVFIIQPLRVVIATGGMETSLFIFCILAMYERFLVGKHSQWTIFLASAVFFTRPDGLLAIIPIYVFWLLSDWKDGIRAGLINLLMISPWIIWATIYFGSAIPNSITIKSTVYSFFPTGHAAWFLISFLASGTVGPYTSIIGILMGATISIFLLIIGIKYWFYHKKEILIIISYPLLYIVVMSILNPAMYFCWYYLPLIPGLMTAYFGAFLHFSENFKIAEVKLLPVLSLILLIIPTILLMVYPTFPTSRTREIQFLQACNEINGKVERGDVILTPDIGVIGWCFPTAYILDPVGLVTPEVTHYLVDYYPGIFLSPKLVFNYKPDFVLFLENFGDPGLLKNDRFNQEYELIIKQTKLPGFQIQPYYGFMRRE